MKKGFTLIEVIVVISTIAILGVIIVPIITSNIKDSRISKAKNDIQSIGKMMIQCREDMGEWPIKDRNGNDAQLLIGTTPNPDVALIPGSNASSWNHSPNESFWWELIKTDNAKQADGEYQYPFHDPNPHNLPSWNGPYLNNIELDPWGNPYLSNINYLEGCANPDNTKKVWIISAGVNKKMDTNFEGDSLSPGADDIGFSIQ